MISNYALLVFDMMEFELKSPGFLYWRRYVKPDIQIASNSTKWEVDTSIFTWTWTEMIGLLSKKLQMNFLSINNLFPLK